MRKITIIKIGEEFEFEIYDFSSFASLPNYHLLKNDLCFTDTIFCNEGCESEAKIRLLSEFFCELNQKYQHYKKKTSNKAPLLLLDLHKIGNMLREILGLTLLKLENEN